MHRWEFIVLPLFSTVVPSNICMLWSCRPFVVITTFSTPTRPVENVITSKGLQYRNIHILDGTTVENKGKLILTETSHRCKNMIFKCIDTNTTSKVTCHVSKCTVRWDL